MPLREGMPLRVWLAVARLFMPVFRLKMRKNCEKPFGSLILNVTLKKNKGLSPMQIKWYTWIVCFLALFSVAASIPPPAAATEPYRPPPFAEGFFGKGPVEDLIDIHVARDKLVAVKQGGTVSEKNLQLKEKVRWQGSRGYIGAVLTSERLLAVSANLSGWVELDLQLAEGESGRLPEILLSDRLLLMTTKKRLIGFDGGTRSWAVIDIPLHEQVVERAIDAYVAVVVTTGRVYGLARGAGSFIEEPFKRNESVLSLDTSAYNASIRTTRRLLIFKSSGAYWREMDLN